MTENDAYYLIDKWSETIHIIADVYFHDQCRFWVSEEPCGFCTTVQELSAAKWPCELDDWDGRKNYICDDVPIESVKWGWDNIQHASFQSLEQLPDGEYLIPYKN